MNSGIYPSEYVLSLHPASFWISRIDQMQQISNSVKSIVIQGCVGRGNKLFSLYNLPSLLSLKMGADAFSDCRSIMFESMND